MMQGYSLSNWQRKVIEKSCPYGTMEKEAY
jgi:hypothetical protein